MSNDTGLRGNNHPKFEGFARKRNRYVRFAGLIVQPTQNRGYWSRWLGI